MTITALNNQNYQDLSIQLTGRVDNALLIAKENGVAPSEKITAGTTIYVPEDLVNDEDIFRYYDSNEILPATGLSQINIDEVEGCQGVGCWRIGVDFVIS